ncbi:MAG: hypothetical protein M1142_00195 [Patescibacteria group bacterium]|nr:hypothetical protein [Patescibacteria group bacterium]
MTVEQSIGLTDQPRVDTPETDIQVLASRAEISGKSVYRYLEETKKEGLTVDEHDPELQQLAGEWDNNLAAKYRAEGREDLARYIEQTPFLSY